MDKKIQLHDNVSKIIFFDVDGVIVDSDKISVACKIKTFKKYYNLEMSKYQPLHSSISLKHLVKKVNKEFKKNIQVQDFIDRREEMYEKEIKGNLKVFEGFQELYLKLKKKEFKVGLVTSATKRKFEANLKEAKLNLFFDTIVTADDVEKQKPNPEQYLCAANNLNTEPKICFVVEDSPSGVAAAKKAGMVCIAITNTVPKERLTNADYIISNLIEIQEILQI